MWISRRRFLAKDIVALLDTEPEGADKNLFSAEDEKNIVKDLEESYTKLDETYGALMAQKFGFGDDYKYGVELDSLTKSMSNLLYILDGCFFEAKGSKHLELNWLKSHMQKIKTLLDGIETILKNDEFVRSLISGPTVFDSSFSGVSNITEEFKKLFKAIEDNLTSMELLRSNPENEHDLWMDYTKDSANSEEELVHNENIIKDLIQYYMSKFGPGTTTMLNILKKNIAMNLKKGISMINSNIIKTKNAFLNPTEKNISQRATVKTQIFRFLQNPNAVVILRENDDYQEWLQLIETLAVYAPVL